MSESTEAISRVWHGWTLPENADAYQQLVTDEVLPSMGSLGGCLGAQMMRRDGDDEVEFLVITEWDSLDAVKAFAGEDYEKTTIPYDAAELLSRYDDGPVHYARLYAASTGAGS